MADNTNILAGVGAIVNHQNVKSGVNIDELARSLIRDGLIPDQKPTQSEEDPAEKFNAELAHAAKKLGISFEEIGAGGTDHSDSDDSDRPARSPPRVEELPDDEGSHSGEDGGESPHYGSKATSHPQGVGSGGSPQYGSRGTPSFATYTKEQIRRKHIENIIGGDANRPAESEYFTRERDEQTKADMLGEISTLMIDLEEEGIDLRKIREVDSNSSMADIRNTLMTLRYRSDNMRCSSTAGEVLMLAAKTIEKLFNGEREILGYYPNMSGWSNSVAPKVRRLRAPMGRVVQEILEDNGVGPLARVMMEIVPSAVMYGVTRSQQVGEPGLFRDIDT